jgi:N-acetylglutamate synthase-like GNAT family acetyltransferase
LNGAARQDSGGLCATTQTADWFERFGFKSCEIDLLPAKRKEKMDQKARITHADS